MGIKFLKYNQDGTITGYLNPEFLDRALEAYEIEAEIDESFDIRDWYILDGKLNKRPEKEIEQREIELYNFKQSELRKKDYTNEADTLFFDYQRGEIDKQVWLDKVQEIKSRYPFK